jgi:hypothetical protein
MNNTSFKIKGMKRLIQQGLDNVMVDRWEQCVELVKGVEADTCKADDMQDNSEPLTVNFSDNRPSSNDLPDEDHEYNSKDNDHYTEGTETLHLYER